jgi:hypothetical protein
MIKNLIVISPSPLAFRWANRNSSNYPRTKSRDLLKGKVRYSSRGQQKAAPKGGFSLASSVEPKLGQAERAGVLAAIGHEAQPHEAESPGRGLGDGGGDSFGGK